MVRRRVSLSSCLAVAAALAGLALPGTAAASIFPDGAPSILNRAIGTMADTVEADGECTETETRKAFLRFGDLSDYALAPDGGFENGAAGWTRSLGAFPVWGNEWHFIAPGRRALFMGPLSYAVSPPFCVDESHPYFRFMVQSNFFLGSLFTAVIWRNAEGRVTGSLLLTWPRADFMPKAWWPTFLRPLSMGIPEAREGGAVTAQLVFATIGGSYLIDNVMVDPYRRR